jgi:hypothetical protein
LKFVSINLGLILNWAFILLNGKLFNQCGGLFDQFFHCFIKLNYVSIEFRYDGPNWIMFVWFQACFHLFALVNLKFKSIFTNWTLFAWF